MELTILGEPEELDERILNLRRKKKPERVTRNF